MFETQQNFTLKSPVKSGKTLVLVEKDDWILDYKIVDIKSYAERVSFPVKKYILSKFLYKSLSYLTMTRITSL